MEEISDGDKEKYCFLNREVICDSSCAQNRRNYRKGYRSCGIMDMFDNVSEFADAATKEISTIAEKIRESLF